MYAQSEHIAYNAFLSEGFSTRSRWTSFSIATRCFANNPIAQPPSWSSMERRQSSEKGPYTPPL